MDCNELSLEEQELFINQQLEKKHINQDVIFRAKKDAVYTVLKHNYETLLRNGNYEQFEYFQKACECLEQTKELIGGLSDPMLKEFETVWITLTPEQVHGFDDNPQEFAKKIKTWLDKCKYVKEYAFSIEQRSSDIENTHGVHAHIVLKRVDMQTYSRYIEWVKRTWASYHGTNFKFFGKNKIGSVYFKDAEFYEKKLDYLKGNKDGTHKQELVACDKLFRDKYGLEQLYVNS